MTEWLKDCEICNAGLCANVDSLKDQCGSVNKACKRMEEEAAEKFGTVVWTWNQIRHRYSYYKSLKIQEKGSPKRAQSSNQKSQDKHFTIVAKRLTTLAEYISKNCEFPIYIPEATLGKVRDSYRLLNILLEELK